MGHPAYVLCGPTASGKTELAHCIARRQQWPILSADAMQVYVGLDRGTAKPSVEERADLVYGGLDWVTPDQPYSVGAYREAALRYVQDLPRSMPVLVVGGTGLYIKALLAGLDAMPPVDAAVREAVQQVFAEHGLAGLQAECRRVALERYDRLADPNNPRRVMRALELALMGVPLQPTWSEAPIRGTVTVLDVGRDQLHERIRVRTGQMFATGLVAEAAAVQTRWPSLSRTARHAIGYREAWAVLAGEMDTDAAVAAVEQRTRQYARRQRTWFRHQLPAEHIEAAPDESVEALADRVLAGWRRGGGCELNMRQSD